MSDTTSFDMPGPPTGLAAAALDVGSSRITCMVGEAQADYGLRILGLGRRPALGVRHGSVVDIRATAAAIRAAVRDAERAAGVAINRVALAFSGGRLASRRVQGQARVRRDVIDDADMRRALDAALRVAETPGRLIVHAIPVRWVVDNVSIEGDPRRRAGSELRVDVLIVSARAGPARNLLLAVQRAGLEVRSLTATPYAAGLASVYADEAKRGAILVDVGAGTASAAIFHRGLVQHVVATPVGGVHVSQDLAAGLSVTLDMAEDLKRREGGVGNAWTQDHAPLHVRGVGSRPSFQTSKAQLAHFMRPRMDEIFELLAEMLAASPAYGDRGVVVLTGGGANLQGALDSARGIFRCEARLGAPLRTTGLVSYGPFASDGHRHLAVSVGLVRYALRQPADARRGAPQLAPAVARAAAVRMGEPAGAWRRGADWLMQTF